MRDSFETIVEKAVQEIATSVVRDLETFVGKSLRLGVMSETVVILGVTKGGDPTNVPEIRTFYRMIPWVPVLQYGRTLEDLGPAPVMPQGWDRTPHCPRCAAPVAIVADASRRYLCVAHGYYRWEEDRLVFEP